MMSRYDISCLYDQAELLQDQAEELIQLANSTLSMTDEELEEFLNEHTDNEWFYLISDESVLGIDLGFDVSINVDYSYDIAEALFMGVYDDDEFNNKQKVIQEYFGW